MSERGNQRTRTGRVVSNRMDKTVVVAITRRVRHSKYRKFLTRRSHYKVHDAQNQCEIGDTVQIAECRPLSRDKRWRLSKIMERAAK